MEASQADSKEPAAAATPAASPKQAPLQRSPAKGAAEIQAMLNATPPLAQSDMGVQILAGPQPQPKRKPEREILDLTGSDDEEAPSSQPPLKKQRITDPPKVNLINSGIRHRIPLAWLR